MAEKRSEMLQKINEISFTINDLTLYLDTHPLDTNAMDEFGKAVTRRKNLMKTYAEQYEPLTVDCVEPEQNNSTESETKYQEKKHFTWLDGPLPWELQGGGL